MILVLRALKLADLLVAVPALRAIRGHWPGHPVVLACPVGLKPVVELTGCVTKLLNLHGAGPRSMILLDNLHPARCRPRLPWPAPGRSASSCATR